MKAFGIALAATIATVIGAAALFWWIIYCVKNYDGPGLLLAVAPVIIFAFFSFWAEASDT